MDVAEQSAYDELYVYTMIRPNPPFVLQHVVDAWTAQRAGRDTKPIALAFALVGLYLHVELGYTGRAVQQVHMTMGRHKVDWPSFALPLDRGRMTPLQVMAVEPGEQRDLAIDAWCRSVWDAFSDNRERVVNLLQAYSL